LLEPIYFEVFMRSFTRFLVFLLLVFWSAEAYAQPANDECAGAIPIQNVANFCSANGQYTTVGATPSNLGPPVCWNSVQNDVWFSFKAIATDVTITIKGNTPASPGGSLNVVQAALYLADCIDFNELECGPATPGANIVELYQAGLFVGTTYLIRVQGGNSGTFQICLNNYNPPVTPTSDCPTASLLCDKSPFAVQQLIGGGLNNLEMEDVPCFSGGAPGINETNSTWFKWICSKSGPLTFKLTPLNITDDLDFVVYRLPNGINNCDGKVVERCMAAGSASSQCPTVCCGPTGLRPSSNDISENPGCGGGNDNWISPLDMVQGQAYALVVNNFSETGNGFTIEWGGTGEFLGPEATFTTDPAAVCIGVPVVVRSTATFALGTITTQRFSFGADAQPQTGNGPGPHTVQFNESGQQSVVMIVETNLGCKVTKIQEVTVFPKVEVDTVIAVPDCNGGTNGAVSITNIQSGTPPYLYSWNNGPFQASNMLSGLGVSIW
jgi:SprB repeat